MDPALPVKSAIRLGKELVQSDGQAFRDYWKSVSQNIPDSREDDIFRALHMPSLCSLYLEAVVITCSWKNIFRNVIRIHIREGLTSVVGFYGVIPRMKTSSLPYTKDNVKIRNVSRGV